MTEFSKHLNILTDSCKEVIEQMTRLTVKKIDIEKAEDRTIKLPYAHMIAYTDQDEKVDGNFILAFQNAEAALHLASAISERLGLERFTSVCEDSTDLLNEFLNVVVGRTISEWDSIGLSAKFNTPVFKKNHKCEDPKLSKAYLIVMDILSDAGDTVNLDTNNALCQIVLRVDFSDKVNSIIQNKKILLVEDSKVMRTIIRKILINEGAIVKEATDGKVAIELHKSFRPDLTLMDINMPNMNGFESISHIREFQPDSKFIILSSSSRKDEIVSAGSLKVAGYLIKPVEPEELIRRVSELL